MKKLVIGMMVLALALVAVPAMAGIVGSPQTVNVTITVDAWCELSVTGGPLTLTVTGIGTFDSNDATISVSANASGNISLSGSSATDGTNTIDFATRLDGLASTGDSFALGDTSWALDIEADESDGGSYVAPGTYTGTVTVTASMP